MKLQQMPVADMRPYENNPRLNNDAVDAVAASIREFGFRQPIVVDQDNVIIVGHARWKAAKKLGLETVPVHVATDLTAENIRAYRIADNKTGELSDWDYNLLSVELGELAACDYDMGLLGFGSDELAKLLDPQSKDGNCDPDELPEPPDEATTQPGNLWKLGRHRLMCGDGSKREDVDRLLDGADVHLVNTDPPYNVNVAPRSNNAITAGESSFKPAGEPGKPSKMRAKDRRLANDFVSDEEFRRLLSAWFGHIARVLLPGHAFYLWGGYANVANYPPAMKQAGLYFSQAVIWHKMHAVLTRKDFMGDHEWCFYGWRQGAAHRFFGPNNASDVWQVPKVASQNMVHLTEKPVELAMRAIEYSSLAGENVLDLFGGSGSTLIACERTGRLAHLMEIDPLYCDVIVQRWERFTGKKAELAT